MDQIRDRRAGANYLDERVAGPGLKWENGQLALNIGRKQPVRTNPSGEVVFEFDSTTMEVSPGSPYTLRGKTAARLAVVVERAEATIRELQAENAALRARMDAQEAVAVTLNADVVSIDARLQALEVLP
jgi:hypothetical protein